MNENTDNIDAPRTLEEREEDRRPAAECSELHLESLSYNRACAEKWERGRLEHGEEWRGLPAILELIEELTDARNYVDEACRLGDLSAIDAHASDVHLREIWNIVVGPANQRRLALNDAVETVETANDWKKLAEERLVMVHQLANEGTAIRMQLDAARGVLRDFEWHIPRGPWTGHPEAGRCPKCDRHKKVGHSRDCDLARVLGGPDE